MQKTYFYLLEFKINIFKKNKVCSLRTFFIACPNLTSVNELHQCFISNNLSESAEVGCENGFESVFDKSVFTSTVVTDYQLVCSNVWIDLGGKCHFLIFFHRIFYLINFYNDTNCSFSHPGKDTVISSLTMAGLFCGVFIFGPIIDRFGRLNAILTASIGLVLVQLPLIFIPVSVKGLIIINYY